MGSMIQNRIGAIVGTLVVIIIAEGVAMYVTQAVAQEKIAQLGDRQTTHERVSEKTLEKIDGKLGEIVKAIQAQSIEAAKAHHDHPR